MKYAALLLAFIIFSPASLLADRVGYGDQHTISDINNRFGVVHMHDWSSEKVSVLFDDLANHEAFLSEANDFSFIQVFDSKKKSLFIKPSPALTVIWISPDSKFIVGLSDIMLNNPYQLIIWRTDGTLVHKEHISSRVARLSQKELDEFYLQYPTAKTIFKNRYSIRNDTIYLDYEILGVADALGNQAWNYLYSREAPHPYSDDFSSSVTNSVYWFNAKEPRLAIRETKDTICLSLASPSGKMMQIEFPRK